MVKRNDNSGQIGYVFESASVILPVINETHSLLKTVEIIENDCASDVKEYLIVVCHKTTLESIKIGEKLRSNNPERFIGSAALNRGAAHL